MRSKSVNSNIYPVAPDTHTTILLAIATAQASDFADDTATIRLTGMTTAGAQLNFYANLQSTAAAVPSSGTTSNSTAGVSIPVLGSREFNVAGSTGFSVIAPSSGYVHVECWKR